MNLDHFTLAAVLVSIGSASAAAALAVRRDLTWKRCPECRSYHRGNIITKSLPLDADSVIHPQYCKFCRVAEASIQGRAPATALKTIYPPSAPTLNGQKPTNY